MGRSEAARIRRKASRINKQLEKFGLLAENGVELDQEKVKLVQMAARQNRQDQINLAQSVDQMDLFSQDGIERGLPSVTFDTNTSTRYVGLANFKYPDGWIDPSEKPKVTREIKPTIEVSLPQSRYSQQDVEYIPQDKRYRTAPAIKTSWQRSYEKRVETNKFRQYFRDLHNMGKRSNKNNLVYSQTREVDPTQSRTPTTTNSAEIQEVLEQKSKPTNQRTVTVMDNPDDDDYVILNAPFDEL